MTPSVLRLLAPCKFNLYLDVLSRRPDGYHEVITVMEPLDLADVLVLEPAGAGITVTADRDDVPDGPGNLAYRGLELLRRRLGVAAGIRVSIGKRIPAAAGLGGGSSDAAAALAGACRLWGLPPPPGLLEEICAELGSDPAFFLHPATSLCRGRGEAVAPLPPAPPLQAVLVNPGAPLPTAWAYGEIDRLPPRRPPGVEPLLAALEGGDLEALARSIYNVFEEVARRHRPDVVEVIDFLRGRLELGAVLAGSGATVVGLARSREEAEAVGREARRALGPSVFVAVASNRVPPPVSG
ncbi:MAG TPA: 4-(cytidine 5'-diphospho)-2-C-methyl-D-erythritol kinase [bacterium]|nr:4-(cytidine 5'-diphospho)-2-C-methyl-D-erythritol kinase [bacterium]